MSPHTFEDQIMDCVGDGRWSEGVNPHRVITQSEGVNPHRVMTDRC